MVRSFTIEDKQAISTAITEAEKATSAEIVLVISETSDAYQSYVLLIALAAGSLIAGILWMENFLPSFPYFVLAQFIVIALFSFIPILRNLCVYFVPKRITNQRAAHRAYEEYINVSRNIPATVPILVLYISLAEHYAHILTDRLVRGKIPDEAWNSVIDEFTRAARKKGSPNACIETIQHITKQFATHFPVENAKNFISDEVITP